MGIIYSLNFRVLGPHHKPGTEPGIWGHRDEEVLVFAPIEIIVSREERDVEWGN